MDGAAPVANSVLTRWPPVIGLTVFVAGFAIWNLDNIFCNQLRRWRRAVGLPWAVLLEGHAWWQLMTGLGELLARAGCEDVARPTNSRARR